jgi:formaldehyde-activating enzyme involved in methanogenesis
MADDTIGKFINPYTILDYLDFLDEKKVNWESEESKKVYWDNYSVMKTAVDKSFQIGIMKEKTAIAHRMQAMGFPLEQIAQVVNMEVKDIKMKML